MKHTHLSRLDLNLLKVFAAVHRERHITRAGRALFISQSAVSHAIARLRTLFGDPLFVRTPEGMQPTALADRLADPIGRALQSISDAMQVDRRFDPAAAASCLDQLTRAECQIAAVDLRLCDRALRGTVPEGEACGSSLACAEGVCAIEASCPGHCRAAAIGGQREHRDPVLRDRLRELRRIQVARLHVELHESVADVRLGHGAIVAPAPGLKAC